MITRLTDVRDLREMEWSTVKEVWFAGRTAIIVSDLGLNFEEEFRTIGEFPPLFFCGSQTFNNDDSGAMHVDESAFYAHNRPHISCMNDVASISYMYVYIGGHELQS
jgi:hypothetical protein